MTDPEATDADRQEQQATASTTGPELADEVSTPADDVPEADAIEQQLTATPGGTSAWRSAPEADEYDVLEQQTAVPDDEDDVRG